MRRKPDWYYSVCEFNDGDWLVKDAANDDEVVAVVPRPVENGHVEEEPTRTLLVITHAEKVLHAVKQARSLLLAAMETNLDPNVTKADNLLEDAVDLIEDLA